MDVNIVRTLMEEALEINKELFLISFSISNGGDIEVIVDGDNGVSLEECIRISRHIEHNLDREVEDFGLSVKSPDIMKPLVHPRQYIKNVGRKLQVSTKGEKIEGTLVSIEDDKISLEWKAREPKPIGKGKHTVTKQAVIAIEDIEKATVKIVFN
ncbi:MAG TPA: ribosome assembly cofactor RimP [Lutibacter sp.]|nr:ribosome assembly cofactor RimP [Lutibacter sp.]